MNMKNYLFFGGFILFFAFLVYSSQAEDTKNNIFGKWVNKNESEELEFVKDGTVIGVNEKNSTVGSYKFIDDNRIKLDFGSKGMKVYEVTFDKNGELSLKDPNGNVNVYIFKKE